MRKNQKLAGLIAVFSSLILSSFVCSAAFAVPPSEAGMNPFSAQLNTQIYNSTISSTDGTPNPFNPLKNNIDLGVISSQLYSPQPFNANGWYFRVTKAYRGLSDLAAYSSLGWINIDTNARGIFLPSGAATGSQGNFTPGNQRLALACVTGNSYFNYLSNINYFPMIVVGKASVGVSQATYRVYCEDLTGPDSDYDYNDHGYIFEVYAAVCSNGVDDDGDGYTDLNDPGCLGDPYRSTERGYNACDNGLDDDGDGFIDQLDPICAGNPAGNTEASQCQDGIDNDRDGLVDLYDPGCSSNQDNDESNALAQCQDGIDNDKDGLVDLNDPGCSSKLDNDETNVGTEGGCTDTSTKTTKLLLDDAAQTLSALTYGAANQLSKNAKKIMSGSSLTSVQTDASRAKAKADRFQQQVEELLIGYPDVVKVCPTAPVLCNTVDRTDTISQLRELYAAQLGAVKRTVARSYFNSVQSTVKTRKDPLVVNAKSTYNSGNAALNALPPVDTVCN